MSGRGEARRGGGYQRPAARSNFELFSWFFMRISGVVLMFMAVYHLVWWNLVVGVHHLSADMVRERWTNPFWRLFNVGLISFALLHGLNGARYSIEDYVRGPGLQTAVKTVVYLIGIAALMVGVYALLTFNPQVHA